MFTEDKIYLGQGLENAPSYLRLDQANRHGLIAGASGTGKTVTMKVIAEGFSKAGVPVFLADAKGDVRGLCQPGADSEKMQDRLGKFGIADEWSYEGCPCRFWNVLEGDGIPVRVTVSEMGPTLLSRLLGLTDAQAGVLDIVFRVADDMQLLLDDIKDLRAMLNYVSEHAKEYQTTYGNVSAQSVGAILRALISVEDQGGKIFFGLPSIDLNDWFACDANGQGYVNILDATKLVNSPQVYAMFLLWMLSQLFEALPEVGDAEKPKFVFFFDEAHLLFNDMPSELLSKIIQVVKLIRSKAVGVYFISQSPSDIPDEVLAQLSNRVQHGLRAYTPAEQKAVKAAAQSFMPNPAFKTDEVLLNLGTGEALVSCLDEDGRPTMVDQVKIFPAQCMMGAAEASYVQATLSAQADLMSKYGEALDRESASEDLQAQAEAKEAEDALAAERAQLEKEREEFEKQKAAEEAKKQKELEKQQAAAQKAYERELAAQQRAAQKQAEAEAKAAQKRKEQFQRDMMKGAGRVINDAGKQVGRQMSKQVGKQVGRQIGDDIVRGILGNFLR